jgi:hypothetical protein
MRAARQEQGKKGFTKAGFLAAGFALKSSANVDYLQGA